VTDTPFAEYPKIETLYDRDERHRVIVGKVRMPEVALIREWHVSEKIDGTNLRVCFGAGSALSFKGRTDTSQLPAALFDVLKVIFTEAKLAEIFPDQKVEITLFGEAYGRDIQDGRNYRPTYGVRLFDVKVGQWWLEPENIADVALKVGVRTVPALGVVAGDRLPTTIADLQAIVSSSHVAIEDGGLGCRAEGIVARTVPGLFCRTGERLMWKLKFKDFPRTQGTQEAKP
jgi:hypothetical protein